MKRFTLMIVCMTGVIAAMVHAAELQVETITVTMGTNTNALAVVTNFQVAGYIEEIRFDLATAGATADVSLVTAPGLASLAGITLASSNACAADADFRPRFDATGTGGGALTSDPPWRYLLLEEALLASMTNANVTGLVVNILVKYAKQ